MNQNTALKSRSEHDGNSIYSAM